MTTFFFFEKTYPAKHSQHTRSAQSTDDRREMYSRVCTACASLRSLRLDWFARGLLQSLPRSVRPLHATVAAGAGSETSSHSYPEMGIKLHRREMTRSQSKAKQDSTHTHIP